MKKRLLCVLLVFLFSISLSLFAAQYFNQTAQAENITLNPGVTYEFTGDYGDNQDTIYMNSASTYYMTLRNYQYQASSSWAGAFNIYGTDGCILNIVVYGECRIVSGAWAPIHSECSMTINFIITPGSSLYLYTNGSYAGDGNYALPHAAQGKTITCYFSSAKIDGKNTSDTSEILEYGYSNFSMTLTYDCPHEERTWVNAVASDCYTEGTIGHYYCETCGAILVEDGDDFKEVDLDSIKTPIQHGQLSPTVGVVATCNTPGVRPAYQCGICGKYLIKDDLGNYVEINESDMISPEDLNNHENLVKHDAVQSTCTKHGNIEYYYCDACGQYYIEEDNELVESCWESIELPYYHPSYIHHDIVTASCTHQGNIEYYTCSECGAYFVSSEGNEKFIQVEESDIFTPIDMYYHTAPIYQAARSSTCCSAGNDGYYVCADCGAMYTIIHDECYPLAAVPYLEFDHTNHLNSTYHPAVASTCSILGNSEYYTCNDCGTHYTYLNGDYCELTAIPYLGYNNVHCSLTLHEAKAATCCSEGNIEYYTCNDCGQCLIVAEGGSLVSIPGELVRLPIDPQNHANSPTHFEGRVNPSTTSEGYEGDIICDACHVKIQDGKILPMIVIDLDDPEKQHEVKEIISDNIQNVIESIGTSTSMTDISDAISKADVGILADISDAASGAMNDIENIFNGVADDEKIEIQDGVSLTKSEALDIVNSVTEAAVFIAGDKTENMQEISDLANNLPPQSDLDLVSTIGGFYDKVMAELLGGASIDGPTACADDSVSAAGDEGNSGIDFSVSAETYKKAVDFVNSSIDNMASAAKQIRECSGESLKASINTYIQGVSVQSFRDFDRAAADEEFLQASYRAILLKLQESVLSTLKSTYEEAKKGKTGTALSELTKTYNDEVAAVSKLHFEEDIPDEECTGCFEDIVIEVMRQKYCSILNNKFSANEITADQYNAHMDIAKDVVAFAPKYKAIFRCWALNEPDTSDIVISLEELSNAAIENSTRKLTESPHISSKMSYIEIAIFGSFAVAVVALLAVAIVVSKRSKLGEVNS